MPTSPPTHIIETTQLTKSYGAARGIIDVNLTVEEGEIFGFIGPNGAGKSTAIRTLLGLIHPTGGSATIFGKDCVTHGPEIRRDVGYLPAEVSYYRGMRVHELLQYSASFYRRDCTARIGVLAKILDLDLERKISDLSLGNRKKVGIVQALLHAPKLIILDEPTSGLDPLIQQQFFHILEQERRAGITILLSSHNLTEVQRLCDRIAIIREGRIIQTGRVSELAGGQYKRVRVESKQHIDPKLFAAHGVKDLVLEGRSASFVFRGDPNDLIRSLASIELTDVLVTDPDLEEIFLHYYR